MNTRNPSRKVVFITILKEESWQRISHALHCTHNIVQPFSLNDGEQQSSSNHRSGWPHPLVTNWCQSTVGTGSWVKQTQSSRSDLISFAVPGCSCHLTAGKGLLWRVICDEKIDLFWIDGLCAWSWRHISLSQHSSPLVQRSGFRSLGLRHLPLWKEAIADRHHQPECSHREAAGLCAHWVRSKCNRGLDDQRASSHLGYISQLQTQDNWPRALS